MADSATTSNRFRKQSLASNVAVWGDPYLNTNFDLLDSALDGVTTIALGTSTATTLTSTNYAADESRSRVLVLTGTGTQTTTVTNPQVAKNRLVINQSSGAVVFISATGTGCTVTAGQSAWIYSDGTNYNRGDPTLDKVRAPTSSVAMNGQRITGLAAGTASDDAMRVDQIGSYVGSASAWASTASGWASTASGWASTASGWNSTASGWASTASGWASTASGWNSTASGWASTASGWAAGITLRYYVGTATGTNALTGTSSPTITAWAQNQLVTFAPPNANTGAVTVAFDSGGTKTVQDGAAAALASGALLANTLYMAVYDGTNVRLPNALIEPYARSFQAAQRGTVGSFTGSGTVTLNFNSANYFSGTVSANMTLGNGTNATAGQGGSIRLFIGTASPTISLGANWKIVGGTASAFSTASGKIDRIDYLMFSTTEYHYNLSTGVA